MMNLIITNTYAVIFGACMGCFGPFFAIIAWIIFDGGRDE